MVRDSLALPFALKMFLVSKERPGMECRKRLWFCERVPAINYCCADQILPFIDSRTWNFAGPQNREMIPCFFLDVLECVVIQEDFSTFWCGPFIISSFFQFLTGYFSGRLRGFLKLQRNFQSPEATWLFTVAKWQFRFVMYFGIVYIYKDFRIF